MNCLCNDTLNLIKLLKKYNYDNLNLNLNLIKITKNKFFMNLYDNMKNILKKNKVSLNSVIIEKLEEKPLNYLKDSNFTSKNIKNNILSKLKYCYKITNNNTEIIYFSSKKILLNKLPTIIQHMLILTKLLKVLFDRNIYQKIIYFETLLKKKLPKKNNKILGPNEVNSGLTFIDSIKNGYIILFRKEEILKVLIHELIHSNSIDRKIIYSNQMKEFNNIFCSNYKILLNEAFTESLATIINLFYINIHCKLNKKNLDNMFFNEIKYLNYVCSKIMYYNKIKKISDIIKNNDSCITKFYQYTNVFSYYILKNILLTNHIEFSKIIEKYNDNYKINNENAINEIIQLIINNINKIDNKIYDVSKDKNKSLRLCLYEIKLL